MDRPIPRVELGLALRGIATAAIDVSDGLVGDLGHLLDRSGVGCELHWRRVPCSPWVQTLPLRLRQSCVLAGGDAYELLFTAAPEHRSRIESLATRAVPLTHIGRVRAQPGLEWVDDLGPVDERPLPGLRAFDHFPEDARHDHQQ
jgi:thiamine-monophosphate kinase